MTIIIAFAATSFIASALVVSACALSSRLSQQEGWSEQYVEAPETTSTPVTKPATPFSMN